MAAIDSHHIEMRALCFFDLPRELRDEIYSLICTTLPRTTGPLEGYVDVPSPSSLAVCRQMHAEFLPIFRKSLAIIISKDRVCFRLGRGTQSGHHNCAGWNIWQADKTRRKFTIWARHGKDEDEYAAWWVETLVLHWGPLGRAMHHPSPQHCGWQAAHRFAGVLEKMIKLEKICGIPVGVRLMNVYCRVRKAIAEEGHQTGLRKETSAGAWGLSRLSSALELVR